VGEDALAGLKCRAFLQRLLYQKLHRVIGRSTDLAVDWAWPRKCAVVRLDPQCSVSSGGGMRAASTVLSPRRTKARPTANPIPRDAPVTIAGE
jgi:hypothetical protein